MTGRVVAESSAYAAGDRIAISNVEQRKMRIMLAIPGLWFLYSSRSSRLRGSIYYRLPRRREGREEIPFIVGLPTEPEPIHIRESARWNPGGCVAKQAHFCADPEIVYGFE